ncbi:dihydroneopterin aldolase [Facilibium subflavum]|uniref:dihydroneopterin aldolase n=1 Tax=Facilibium subflavum TaxID=2219058 RepID=UPI0013C2E370|nr:dihydroneopterin aldolase [Facilibium subflavum]
MYQVSLRDIQLSVYLGVYDFEQVEKQTIKVDMDLNFHTMPDGCQSDKLEDVICYAKLNEAMLTAAAQKRYQLIEHLAFSLLQAIKAQLTIPADIRVSVYKRPPLDNVGYAIFTMEQPWQTSF